MTVRKYRDGFEDLINHVNRLNREVYLDANAIVFNVHDEYYIELNRCDTPEKILGWILQLSEKTWITTDHLGKFVQVACEQIGLNPENLA